MKSRFIHGRGRRITYSTTATASLGSSIHGSSTLGAVSLIMHINNRLHLDWYKSQRDVGF